MTVNEIKETLKTPEYEFLKTNPHLGNNIILLGLGGSHAYGNNVEGSDVDVRGIALNSTAEILGTSNFEQVVNEAPVLLHEFHVLIENLIFLIGHLVAVGLLQDRELFVEFQCHNMFLL